MDVTIHYLEQAISGTGQDGKTQIDIYKIQRYLKRFSEKFFGQSWRIWLRGIGLETIEDIESAIIEFQEREGIDEAG
jgi:hypothetical protein